MWRIKNGKQYAEYKKTGRNPSSRTSADPPFPASERHSFPTLPRGVRLHKIIEPALRNLMHHGNDNAVLSLNQGNLFRYPLQSLFLIIATIPATKPGTRRV